MTAAQDAVRARRKLTNRLIAAHDAARLTPFLHPDVKLTTGDGTLILGARAVVEAFAGQFADPAFVNYVRSTETVELDQAGQRAAESGRWTALWTGGDADGEPTMGGTYLAVWRKDRGQWVIESELYVTLFEA
ncbi:MAG: nuclear transport factor 2 family protein [Pseudomonadota bacterium]